MAREQHNSRRILRQQLNLGETYELFHVGNGAFGDVYAACTIKNLIAIKALRNEEGHRFGPEYERNMLDSLKPHPNVLRYIGSRTSEDDQFVYLMCEYCAGGDLGQFLAQRRGPLHADEARGFLFQLVAGLDALHCAGIIHRDLKPANIYLTHEGIVRIGDFGVSKKLLEGQQTVSLIGTPVYWAPEVPEGGGYDFKADMWSVGCILYEMLTGEPLFKPGETGYGPLFYMREVVGGAYKVRVEAAAGNVPSECGKLLKRLLQFEAAERPTAREVLECAWFAGYVPPENIRDAMGAELPPLPEMPPRAAPCALNSIFPDSQDFPPAGDSTVQMEVLKLRSNTDALKIELQASQAETVKALARIAALEEELAAARAMARSQSDVEAAPKPFERSLNGSAVHNATGSSDGSSSVVPAPAPAPGADGLSSVLHFPAMRGPRGSIVHLAGQRPPTPAVVPAPSTAVAVRDAAVQTSTAPSPLETAVLDLAPLVLNGGLFGDDVPDASPLAVVESVNRLLRVHRDTMADTERRMADLEQRCQHHITVDRNVVAGDVVLFFPTSKCDVYYAFPTAESEADPRYLLSDDSLANVRRVRGAQNFHFIVVKVICVTSGARRNHFAVDGSVVMAKAK